MPPPPAPPPPSPAAVEFSSLPTHILHTHILPRLDPPSLASATCAATSISLPHPHHHLLWSNLCHSTWPSTADHRITAIISTFPSPQSFFSHSFPLPSPDHPTTPPPLPPPPPPSLISAVDIHHKHKLIFTKVEETETLTSWFRCSPFRLDLVDPKHLIPTDVDVGEVDGDTCTALMDDLRLSWILIDPVHKKAVNLSSHKPVSVQRHWLTGEVRVRFVSILPGVDRSDSPAVECGVVVNFGGDMAVREVSMEVEDMDGRHLNGRDSLVILQGVLEGKRGSGVEREEKGRERYGRFEEMKRKRRERRVRVERALDNLCVAFGLCVFIGWFYVLC